MENKLFSNIFLCHLQKNDEIWGGRIKSHFAALYFEEIFCQRF